MLNVTLYTPGFTSPNGRAFLFPLIVNRSHLKEQGIAVNIVNNVQNNISDCDVLCIDSKAYKNAWSEKEFDQTLESIKKLSEQGMPILWFDQGDSTGFVQAQVLPYVTKYLKAQVLKDRKQYLTSFYADRIYADYYHKKYDVNDNVPFANREFKDQALVNKIGVSWNSGLADYSWLGPYKMIAREKIPCNWLLRYPKTCYPANAARKNELSCRMGINYSRDTISFHRKQIKEKLKEYIPTDKLSRKKYLNELGSSKITISPFGLGEITLKDFEVFLSGSLLLKPNIDHMETWPNWYQDNKTIITHDWDNSDLLEKIEYLKDNEQTRKEIAETGQENYRKYITSDWGNEAFCEHFQNMINGALND